MKIILEVSSPQLLQDQYGELMRDLTQQEECSVVEDPVGYGVEETLVAGVIFVVEAINSGVTYDVVKAFLTQSSARIMQIQQRFSERPGHHIVFYVEGEQMGQRYQLTVNTQEEFLQVDLPSGEQVVVKTYSHKK
jgi:hypothetical protein